MAKGSVTIWASVCHHIGGKACNLGMIEKHVKEALKNKWRVVLLGDLMNNGVSSGSKHVGLEWQDTMDPMMQAEKAVDVFMPLAKAGLIEMIVGGNHAYRSVKACGIHPEKFIAMMLSIAATGEKPAAVLPAVLQRVHELAQLGEVKNIGGAYLRRFHECRDKLFGEIQRIRPGTEDNWSVPFHPGLAFKSIAGVPVVAHHGMHNKSRDNWKQLENAARGFRVYLTGHNHRLGWEPGIEDIQGKPNDADFFSCGTYQGYEEYASIACYSRTALGSLVVEINKSTDKVTFFRLD